MKETEPSLYEAHAETCAMRCSREVGMSALNISLVKPPSGGLKMRSFHMMSMNTAPTAIWIQERTQG